MKIFNSFQLHRAWSEASACRQNLHLVRSITTWDNQKSAFL